MTSEEILTMYFPVNWGLLQAYESMTSHLEERESRIPLRNEVVKNSTMTLSLNVPNEKDTNQPLTDMF